MNLFRRDIISISRLPADTADGPQDYARSDPKNATVIYSNIVADIQQKSPSRKPPANLPGDTAIDFFYEIFISARVLPRGSLKERDYITDENGAIYQVIVPYWTIFGYQPFCEKLQL
jgi:hypothetical protein